MSKSQLHFQPNVPIVLMGVAVLLVVLAIWGEGLILNTFGVTGPAIAVERASLLERACAQAGLAQLDLLAPKDRVMVVRARQTPPPGP